MPMIAIALMSVLASVPSGALADCNGNGIDDSIDLAGPMPLGYWRFEGKGGTVVDHGPNGLDGFGSGLVWVADVADPRVPRTAEPNTRAGLLAGAGLVSVGDPEGVLTRAGGDLAIEAWVRLDQLSDASSAAQRQFLLQKKAIGAGDAGLDYAFLVQKGGDFSGLAATFGKMDGYTGRELMLLFGTGGSTWAVVSNLEVSSTDWRHVSVAYDGATREVRFGVDGAFETISAPGPGHFANAGPLTVGAHSNAAGAFNQFLRGAVDELRILGEVVSTEQLLRSPAMADCNGNGVPDGCDVAGGSSIDCDGDGRPDECQLDGNDCDGNGVPDQCDPDCNANGVADACDLATGVSLDCQGDGVPDECQLGVAAELAYDNGWARIAWRADETYMAWLNRFNVEAGADKVVGIEVLWGIMPLGTVVDAYVWTDPDGDGNPRDAEVLWTGQATVGQTDALSFIPVPEIDVGDDGASFFVGFIMPVTDQDFPASLDIDGVPTPDRSWGVGSWTPIDPNDLSFNAVEFGTINDLLFGNVWVLRARMSGAGTDCNGNGAPDHCDIAAGLSADADGNGVPDECEDCNGNGIVDGFEIAAGSSIDRDGDGVPDECQLLANDCDLDGVPDHLQLADRDCNGNLILDGCDISSGWTLDIDANGVPDECEDCNGNGQLDSVDIAILASEDCDGDGVPDECQFGEPASTVRYQYDDGVQEANIFFAGASQLDFAWMNQFTVEPGGEWISAVEVVWGDTYPDLPAEVVVWTDPDGDGDPTDARVLITVDTRSMKIDFPSDNVNVVPIPPTFVGTAGASFFVGVHYYDVWSSAKPIAIDVDEPHGGRGWIAYAIGGFVDLDNLTAGGLFSWPSHDLLVRAIGADGRFEADCNANQWIDACEIADGATGDANGNGVPDQCELVADLDGDGMVNAADLAILLGAWGPGAGPADLDGDGQVDASDLAILLGAWGG
ncbi:MAG: hypothetical protein RI967_820 [Planctomycetota bacterium]